MKFILTAIVLFVNASLFAQYTTSYEGTEKMMYRESYLTFYNKYITPETKTTLTFKGATSTESRDKVQSTIGTMTPVNMLMRVMANVSKDFGNFRFISKTMPNLFLSTDGAMVVKYDTNFNAWMVFPATGKYYCENGCMIFK